MNLHWQHEGNTFSVSYMDIYQGIITQHIASGVFDAQLLTQDGTIIASWEGFLDFDEAEPWVLFAIIDAEQSDDRYRAKYMQETLRVCREKLHKERDVVHIQRLAYIERWYFTRENQEIAIIQESRQKQTAPDRDEGKSEVGFTWIDEGNGRFSVQTAHGAAIIQEIRKPRSPYVVTGTIKHRAAIIHASGAMLEIGWEVTDFAAAESWIQETLERLMEPRVAETCLDLIVFTLDICIEALRHEPDIFHIQRIQYMKGTIETELP